MRRVGNALTRREGVGVFGSALLRREGVRGFGFGIGCSGVIQMTRDGRRQVGVGRIGVGTVTVVTLTLFCTQLISINWYLKVCTLNICAPTKPSTLDNALCLNMANHVCPLINKGKPQTKGNMARSGLLFWNQL